MYAERLTDTLPRVRETIAAAAERAGRDPGEVTLVAVTKGHPLPALRAALDAGLTHLGENRVGELQSKVEALGHDGITWHMIGHVQSRKAPSLVGLADLVHSVDRDSLAGRLSRAAEAEDTTAPVLIQVNTSGEDSKGGVEGDRMVEEILELGALPGLDVRGLMTMAPYVDDEAVLRGTFRRLRETLERVRRHDPDVGTELSMGMTNDLSYAVEEGSTMVRIGTALFGPRD